MTYDLTHTKDKSEQCQLCHHQKIEGTKYCARHGANKQIIKEQRETLYNFQKTAFLQRTIKLANHGDKYTLTIELGVQRTILEEILNKINDFESILRYNSQINSTTQNIRNLVNDSLKLDERIGEMLSKKAEISLAHDIVDIITEEIDDQDTVVNIVERINAALISKYSG